MLHITTRVRCPGVPCRAFRAGRKAPGRGSPFSDGSLNSNHSRAKQSATTRRNENTDSHGSEEDQESKLRRRGRPTGHRLSLETRRKIAESCRGKKSSKGTREKMAMAKLGRKLSAETRKKISEAHTGKEVRNETRAKMARIRQGRTHHPEVKERIRKSLLDTFAKKKMMRESYKAALRDSFSQLTGSKEVPGRRFKTPYDEIEALRQHMDPWIRHYRRLYGTNPTLDTAKENFPSLYKSMVRYNELLETTKKLGPDR